MDLELRHCQHAVALAEHRNFDRAARALGITQPSLSRSIQQLERDVGTQLFNRGREGVEPSDAGRLFLARARSVLLHAADLEREMQLVRGIEVGELRVGAGIYPTEMFVGDAVARMHREHPRVKLVAVAGDIFALLQMLRRRELDLVVGDARSATEQGDVHLDLLSRYRAHVVVRAGHPLTSRRSASLKDALRYPLAFTSRVPLDLLALLREAQGPATAGETPPPLPAVACDSTIMMRRIVAASDAVTLMPMVLIARELAEGTLATLPVEAPWLGRHFAIIRVVERTPSPAAVRFMQYVREADTLAAALEVPSRSARGPVLRSTSR